MLRKIKSLLALYLDDLLLIAGGACLTVGAAQIQSELGWIVAGGCLLRYGMLVARAGAGRWRK